jgi:sensor histidine kinase YesM
MCIGFTIHTLVDFAIPHIEKLKKVYRLGILLMLFLIGGLAGTGISVVIHKLIFNFSFTINDYSRLLSFNLFLSIIFGSIAVIYFTLRTNAERMESELKEKELNEEKLTRLKMKAELEALQAKINPHFLFNTLNSIASLISENPKAAEATVEKLSELFRYTLKDADKSTVTPISRLKKCVSETACSILSTMTEASSIFKCRRFLYNRWLKTALSMVSQKIFKEEIFLLKCER